MSAVSAAVAMQPVTVSTPGATPASSGITPTFAEMAAFTLRSRAAQALLKQVQLRLGAAFKSVGLTLGHWSGRPAKRDTTMAVSLTTLRVTDPLQEALYEVMLWFSVWQVAPGVAFRVRAEARDVVSGRIFGRCDPVVRSWDAAALEAPYGGARQMLADLAADPAIWEGEHFAGLAAALSVANAP